MWPFRTPSVAPEALLRRQNEVETRLRDLVITVEPLLRRMNDVEEKQERTGRSVREMMAEWENIYEKIYKASQRAGRARQEPRAAQKETGGDLEPAPPLNPAEAGFWARVRARRGG